MTRRLRSGKGKKGLVLANQHAVCLSTEAPPTDHSYPPENVLPPVLDDIPVPQVDDVAEGEAVIEVSIA